MGKSGLEGDRQSGEGLEEAVPRDPTSQLPNIPPQLADDGGGLVGKGKVESRGAGERTVDKVTRSRPQAKLGFKSARPKTGKGFRSSFGIDRDERNLYSRRIPPPDLQSVQAV